MRRAEKINYSRTVFPIDMLLPKRSRYGMDLKKNSLLIFKFEVEKLKRSFSNICAYNSSGTTTGCFWPDKDPNYSQKCIIQTGSVFKSLKFDNKEPILFEKENKILKENPTAITEKIFEVVYILDEDVGSFDVEFNPDAFKFPNIEAYLVLLSIENEYPVTKNFD